MLVTVDVITIINNSLIDNFVERKQRAHGER